MTPRKLPVGRLLGLSAAAAVASIVNGILSAGGHPLTGLGLGLTNLLGGVFANYFAGLSQTRLEEGPIPPESLILNHDLRRLTGEAIEAVLALSLQPEEQERVPIPAAERTAVERLRAAAAEVWMNECVAADSRFEDLSERQLAADLGASEIDFSQRRALDVETWSVFLNVAAAGLPSPPAPTTIHALAGLLHERLPQMLRAKVKQDFQGDTAVEGRGFASLHLLLMGKLLEGMQSLLDRPVAEWERQEELLEQLRLANSRAEAALSRQEKRLGAKDRRALKGVLQQLHAIVPQVRRHIDDVLHAIGRLDAKVTAHHRATSRVLAGIGVGVLILVLLSSGTYFRNATLAGELKEQMDAMISQRQTLAAAHNGVFTPGPLSPEELAIVAEVKRNGNVVQQARAAVAEGEYAEADRLLSNFDPLSARGEELFAYYQARGDRWFWDDENDQRAIAAYLKALEYRPNDVTTRLSLARLYLHDRRGFSSETVPRALELLQGNLALLNSARDSREWVATQLFLAKAWRMLPTGDRVANARKAIKAGELARDAFARLDAPYGRAMALSELAMAWTESPEDDLAHLKNALEAYHGALQIWSREEYPREWAVTATRLAKTLAHRDWGDLRDDRLRRAAAVDLYERAMEVLDCERNPREWAEISANLGTLLACDSPVDAAEHRRGIAALEDALTILTEQRDPQAFGSLQHNLGVARREAPEGELEDNLQAAIKAFEAALRVRTPSSDPAGFVQTQRQLGRALRDLPNGEPQVNLHRALEAFERALAVPRVDMLPGDWEDVHFQMGLISTELSQGGEPQYARRAIAACETVLQTPLPTLSEEMWVATKMNLGIALSRLPVEGSAEAQRKGVESIEEALRFVDEQYPEFDTPQLNRATLVTYLAQAWNVFGDALRQHARGEERQERLQKAKEAYEKSLALVSRDTHPHEFVAARAGWGAAVAELSAGGDAEYERAAIEALDEALEVCMKNAMKVESARILGVSGYYRTKFRDDVPQAVERLRAAARFANEARDSELQILTRKALGYALTHLESEDRAENLTAALDSFQSALSLISRESHALPWAEVQVSQAETYALLAELPRQDRAKLLQRAIACCKGALQALNPEKWPDERGEAQTQLENYRKAYEAIDSAGKTPFESIPAEE